LYHYVSYAAKHVYSNLILSLKTRIATIILRMGRIARKEDISLSIPNTHVIDIVDNIDSRKKRFVYECRKFLIFH